MRLFVGIPIPDNLRRKIYGVYRVLEDVQGVKTVEEENLHITLKFIGEFPEHRLQDVFNALSKIRYYPIDIEISGLGAFPSLSSPRVVWAGIGRGHEEVTHLAKAVERALEPMGVRPEARPFHPHVTLARVKRPCDIVHQFLERNKNIAFGTFTARCFVLFKSTLTSSGPIYTELARFPAEEL